MNHAGVGIKVEGVRKKLGANQALDGISLDLAPGLMHGIIGPEGAGKTTLLRTLVELLHPDEGKVLYSDGGRAVPFAELRPQIAYMPQQQSLYADLTIGEHLRFFKSLYSIPEDEYRRKREELLHITRLERFVDRPAGQLSGGMYKKLGLMCALLRAPRVMLLDEPTNGVDPISRREFWDLLYRLMHENILIVLTTAYLDEAERCGRVHLLEAGRLVADGEPQGLLEREGVESFDALFIKQARAKRERREAKV